MKKLVMIFIAVFCFQYAFSLSKEAMIAGFNEEEAKQTKQNTLAATCTSVLTQDDIEFRYKSYRAELSKIDRELYELKFKFDQYKTEDFISNINIKVKERTDVMTNLKTFIDGL